MKIEKVLLLFFAMSAPAFAQSDEAEKVSMDNFVHAETAHYFDQKQAAEEINTFTYMRSYGPK